MAPPEVVPSAWAEVFIGAAGNLIGGFAAAVLWWLVWLRFERRRGQDAVAQKRNAIALEIAKIQALLRLLKADANRASITFAGRGAGVLGALVRLGPDLTPGRSLEPQLAEVEHRMGMVEAAAVRLFVSTTGLAVALRGNEDELEQLPRIVASEADAALEALQKFEGALHTVK